VGFSAAEVVWSVTSDEGSESVMVGGVVSRTCELKDCVSVVVSAPPSLASVLLSPEGYRTLVTEFSIDSSIIDWRLPPRSVLLSTVVLSDDLIGVD
jgi:hypothetical protein